MAIVCRHCHKTADYERARGLCFTCHRNPAIRQLYPVTSKYGNRHDYERTETEADLDAMIAEQYRRLPPWWWDEDNEWGDRE